MQLYLKTLSVVFVCVNICIKGDFNLIFTESRLSPGSLEMLDFHLAWQPHIPSISLHRFDQYSLKINDIIFINQMDLREIQIPHGCFGALHWARKQEDRWFLLHLNVNRYIFHISAHNNLHILALINICTHDNLHMCICTYQQSVNPSSCTNFTELVTD